MVQGISFPKLVFERTLGESKFCGFYTNEIDVDDNAYYITIDIFFIDISPICVQFNDDTQTGITGRSQEGNENYWKTTATSIGEGGCDDTPSFKQEIVNQQQGAYCIALSSTGSTTNTYNLRVKQLSAWTDPVISISNGGAITIKTDEDVYEFLSISIENSYFDDNYATLAGGLIYH